jgi:RNA ligase
MMPLHKYPRTHHLEGSRRQPGDEDLDSIPFDEIKGQFIVCEEKLDGANSGLSFDTEGRLWLQSRGHYLTGGEREKHFNLFKQWTHAHAGVLRETLGSRYVLYGEWLYARHTIFYDQLPHYFHEFDVYDRETDLFLSTARRQQLLSGLPLVSVPVLWAGEASSLDELTSLIGPSLYKSANWSERLTASCQERGLDPERIWKETDRSDLMEGLYFKVEEGDRVTDRYKWIRASFLTAVIDSGSHWLKRPIIPNLLRDDVDLFGGGS